MPPAHATTAANRRSVQRAEAAPVVTPHRPGKGAQIEYLDETWDVTESGPENPRIKIVRAGNKTMNINWQESQFKIVRPNSKNNFDRRGHGMAGEADKQKALDMMKEWIQGEAGWVEANRRSLTALALDDFAVTQTDARNGQPAEWQATWIQEGKSGRTWTLIIDMDRPLPESDQEPHVGWTLSATSTKKGFEVRNQYGHVWVDAVPASRQG